MRRAGPLSRATPSASSSANLRASEAATCSSAQGLRCTGVHRAGTASSLAAAAAAPSSSSQRCILVGADEGSAFTYAELVEDGAEAAAVAAMAPDSGCRFHSSGGSRCASFARAGSPALASGLRAATATMASTWSLATRYRQRRRGATGATMVAMASACIIRSGWR